jgi:hypothetical protein
MDSGFNNGKFSQLKGLSLTSWRRNPTLDSDHIRRLTDQRTEDRMGQRWRGPWRRVLITAVLPLCLPLAAAAAPISLAAQHLAERIDALDVEHHWPAKQHVNWQTGVPDGGPEYGTGVHTHCSVFVAASAKSLGVYILRPPEHSQVLLANAQYDWLGSPAGTAQGWQPLADGGSAQDYANRGWLVLAAYRNRHDNKPGHIAIVRPSDKDAAALAAEGPQITQAGAHNYRSASLRTGFAGHPAAWARGEVRYYAHAVDETALKD